MPVLKRLETSDVYKAATPIRRSLYETPVTEVVRRRQSAFTNPTPVLNRQTARAMTENVEIDRIMITLLTRLPAEWVLSKMKKRRIEINNSSFTTEQHRIYSNINLRLEFIIDVKLYSTNNWCLIEIVQHLINEHSVVLFHLIANGNINALTRRMGGDEVLLSTLFKYFLDLRDTFGWRCDYLSSAFKPAQETIEFIDDWLSLLRNHLLPGTVLRIENEPIRIKGLEPPLSLVWMWIKENVETKEVQNLGLATGALIQLMYYGNIFSKSNIYVALFWTYKLMNDESLFTKNDLPLIASYVLSSFENETFHKIFFGLGLARLSVNVVLFEAHSLRTSLNSLLPSIFFDIFKIGFNYYAFNFIPVLPSQVTFLMLQKPREAAKLVIDHKWEVVKLALTSLSAIRFDDVPFPAALSMIIVFVIASFQARSRPLQITQTPIFIQNQHLIMGPRNRFTKVIDWVINTMKSNNRDGVKEFLPYMFIFILIYFKLKHDKWIESVNESLNIEEIYGSSPHEVVTTDDMSRQSAYKLAELFKKEFDVPIEFDDCIKYFSEAEDILNELKSQLSIENPMDMENLLKEYQNLETIEEGN